METKELINQIVAKRKVKSYLLNVLEAFQSMDYHKLNELLEEDIYYEEMSKTSFIYRQSRIFNELKCKGDTKLNLSTNICTGCLCNEPVFVLSGNNSGHKYAIRVQFNNGGITDIFRCAQQSDCFDFLYTELF